MTLPKYITFDCYGTLVDFNLTPVMLERLGERKDQIDLNAFIKDAAKLRFEEVLGEYKPYRDVLKESLRKVFEKYGLEYTNDDGEAIVAAVPEFGPFPEVPGVLERLNQHTKLVIITNSDEDLIPHNVEKIGVPFHRVFTSEQARAYKPSHAAFEYVRKQLGAEVNEILHVAQGFDYDIMPAHDIGWARVWINRHGLPGDPAYGPYDELPDLSGLPGLIGI